MRGNPSTIAMWLKQLETIMWKLSWGQVYHLFMLFKKTTTVPSNIMMFFLHYWPFVRGIHQWLVDSPHKGPAMQSFGVSFDVSLNKLYNNQLRNRWIKMSYAHSTSLQCMVCIIPSWLDIIFYVTIREIGAFTMHLCIAREMSAEFHHTYVRHQANMSYAGQYVHHSDVMHVTHSPSVANWAILLLRHITKKTSKLCITGPLCNEAASLAASLHRWPVMQSFDMKWCKKWK